MKLQTVEAEKILDVRSLTCPLPVIKSMKALEYMYAGSILEIWCVTTEFKDELDQYEKVATDRLSPNSKGWLEFGTSALID